jgi:hypothetical protein
MQNVMVMMIIEARFYHISHLLSLPRKDYYEEKKKILFLIDAIRNKIV